MEDLDMSGVDPLRWAEIRRRVAVVKSYIQLTQPTDADLASHARLLSLSPNQFMALVRAWRSHRSAAKLAGAGAHRGGSRRPSRLAVPGASKEIAHAVIDELGPDAAFVNINAAVAERCARAGIKPPSRSTTWNMVMTKRQDRRMFDDGVIVGTCCVRLPVELDGELVLPPITLAVRSGSGAIIAAALPATFIDWRALVASIAGATTPLVIDQELLPPGTISCGGIMPVSSSRARSMLARTLGRGLDDMQLVYLAKKAIAPERLLTTKDDKPLSLVDARRVAKAATERHNAARGEPMAMWIDGPTARPEAAALR